MHVSLDDSKPAVPKMCYRRTPAKSANGEFVPFYLHKKYNSRIKFSEIYIFHAISNLCLHKSRPSARSMTTFYSIFSASNIDPNLKQGKKNLVIFSKRFHRRLGVTRTEKVYHLK